MKNADIFKRVFGLYATELWAKPECEFLEWLNADEQQEPCGDPISRHAAIAEFSCCELTPDGGIDANYAIDFLEQMPSAQQKSQWIPCSERLPEKSGLYLTWMRFPYEEEPIWTIENYDADVEAFGEWRERYHPETLGYLDSEFEEFKDVTAWMPLPEPYREDGGE